MLIQTRGLFHTPFQIQFPQFFYINFRKMKKNQRQLGLWEVISKRLNSGMLKIKQSFFFRSTVRVFFRVSKKGGYVFSVLFGKKK